MPTYEYACTRCGTHVEVVQRFNDDPLSDCGVCGGPLRKVFHPAGIVFKGSGFYATDSRGSESAKPSDGAAGKGAAVGGDAKGGATAGAKEAPASGAGKGSGSAGSAKEKSA
ncbi:MAG TPA: FmdB family zinc ribbon protein [Actinomycetota bacterium]|nr:FmdB family zinc ribbon protein [Actinomycetota bacterium]